jgi:hypothetical protein
MNTFLDNFLDASLYKWLARLFIILIIVGFLYWLGKKDVLKSETLSGLIKNPFIQTNFESSKKKSHKPENKTENMCRKIIEKIYNKKFPSIRPDFLKNPITGKNLEIDCYNQELRIGLEYNGAQHYKYTPHFHKTKTNFYSQVHRDDWKRKRLNEMGIRLIEVPYWVMPIDLENYITNELKKKNCL